MGLNIKDEETHQLARELARLTGGSMTAALKEALRERLDQLRSKSNGNRAERLLQIGRECAAHLKEPYKSMDIDELLYDKNGMPK